MMHSLSIVVPLFNEEKNLEGTFLETRKSLDHFGIRYEFIFVDDKSTDQTFPVAKKICAQFPNVRVYAHEKNQGIGGAFRTGIRYATLEYILLLPADNPLAPEDLKPYLEKMGQCDIIAGQRKERTGYHPLFGFLSYAYNRILIRYLFGLPLNDVNWIQMYRRKIFTDGGIRIEFTGIFFLTEVLVKARRKNFTIVGVAARMKKRMFGKPSIYRFSIIGNTLRDLVKFIFISGFKK